MDVFGKEKFDQLPPKRPWDHAIELKEGAEPARAARPYHLTTTEQDVLDDFLNENLQTGRIRPSKSPWAAPLFFVKKKGGKLRPVQDYRKLNALTIKNKYPLPLISELLSSLGAAKIFTKLDIRWGFNNVRIREEDCQKAAFLTNRGLFEPTVMFFGLTNSPATFQTIMNEIFRELIMKGKVKAYIDDILIYTETLEEHRKIVEQVLDILRTNGLFLNPEKCEFEKDQVEYLGVIIGKGEAAMDPVKLRGITEWSIPKKLKDVQSFIGFCNFYRKFIKGFSTITRPLHELAKKNQPWQWTKLEQDAFDSLKEAIATAPVLRIPDAEGRFKVEADASNFATGAVLSQEHDGEWYPVAFQSESMDQAQRNYTIHDKEMLAVIRALEEWRHWLLGAKEPFEIWTDHKNLEYFMTAQNLNRRQARWNQFLAEFDYVLKHRPGKTMLKADALSRRSDHDDGSEDNKGVTLLKQPQPLDMAIKTIGEVEVDRSSDPILKKIRNYSKENKWDHEVERTVKALDQENPLWKTPGTRPRRVPVEDRPWTTVPRNIGSSYRTTLKHERKSSHIITIIRWPATLVRKRLITESRSIIGGTDFAEM